jgi:peptide/nickel transport system ATP-binding protein
MAKAKDHYISGGESAQISRFNRKIVRKLERKRAANASDQSGYTVKMHDDNNVVEVDNACAYFFTDIGTIRAVDGVSFAVPKRTVVGIVGESGCGKSVMSLAMMQLLQRPQGQVVGGEIRFNMGNGSAMNIVNTPNKEMMKLRGNRMSMIFQEPMTSLNPVFRCGAQIDEVTALHNPGMSSEEVKKRSIDMLDLVGIADSANVYRMYPHELSGGMRQRVRKAMARACDPQLISADEPTTALDVTIQAQILDLLKSLKDKVDSSIMLITHDLGVIANMADQVVVMYAGRVVEKGSTDEVFHNPSHPYTLGLMKSKPKVGVRMDELYSIPGNVPNPVNMPNYCYFRDRCELRCDKCDGEYPPEFKISASHIVSCWRCDGQGDVVGQPKSVDLYEVL